MFIRFILFCGILFSSLGAVYAQSASELQIVDFGQVSLADWGGTLQVKTGGRFVDVSGGGTLAVGYQNGVIRYLGSSRERMTNYQLSTSPLVGPGSDIAINTIEFSRSNFRLNNSGVKDISIGITVNCSADQEPGVYIGTYSIAYSSVTSWDPKVFIGTVKLEVADSAADLVIAEIASLNFGTLSLGTMTSSVSVDTNGTLTVGSGDVVSSGSPMSGEFDVMGMSRSDVYVSFSSSVNLTNGANTIVLDNLVKDGGNSTPVSLNNRGKGSFTVGGRLTLPPSLSSGTYTGTYAVTVNY